MQVKHALTAQNKLGSDMVTLMGYDSGGLPGEADVGLWIQMALARCACGSPEGLSVFLHFLSKCTKKGAISAFSY